MSGVRQVMPPDSLVTPRNKQLSCGPCRSSGASGPPDCGFGTGTTGFRKLNSSALAKQALGPTGTSFFFLPAVLGNMFIYGSKTHVSLEG